MRAPSESFLRLDRGSIPLRNLTQPKTAASLPIYTEAENRIDVYSSREVHHRRFRRSLTGAMRPGPWSEGVIGCVDDSAQSSGDSRPLSP